MKIKKFLFILMFFLLIFNLSSCFAKKDLNFSYEELNNGLLKIEYCELTVLDESQYSYNRDIILSLNSEEKEYVLQNINNITFEVFYAGPQGLVAGKTLILVYEEYELWIRDRLIEYNWFDGRSGEQVVYTISPNKELQKLIEYIDLNFVNK